MSDDTLDLGPPMGGDDSIPIAFWAQGRLGRSSAWLFLLSFLFVAAMYLGGPQLLDPVFHALTPGLFPYARSWHDLPLGDALLGFGFGMSLWVLYMLLPVFLAVLAIHGRSWLSLLTASRRFRWSQAMASFAVVLLLFSAALGVRRLIWPEDVNFVLDPYPFLVFLPLVLIVLPLQVLSEEVLFRGYLLQLVGRFCARPLVIVLLPAALFCAGHLKSDPLTLIGIWELLNFGLFSIYVTYLALACDGIEHSFGVHLGANFYTYLVQGYEDGQNPVPTLFIASGMGFALAVTTIVAVLSLHYLLVIRPGRGLSNAVA